MLVFELMCLVCTSIDDEVAEAYLVTVLLALQEAFSRQIQAASFNGVVCWSCSVPLSSHYVQISLVLHCLSSVT